MKDTGFKTLMRESKYNFLKWGEYMKRATIAERKVQKLRSLIMLTDPAVSNVTMNDVAFMQWQEFIREFPEEKEEVKNG